MENNMNKSNNILFVSYIQDPYTSGTSTQIMTKNLLSGIKGRYNKLSFVAIIDDNCDSKHVYDYYGKIVDEVIIVNSCLNNYKKKKYMQLFYNFLSAFSSKIYKKEAKGLQISEKDVIIAHAPSFESLFLCNQLKKIYPKLWYIQYWSDPYALSGICPERINYKRKPFMLLESVLLSKCSDIVYGTKTLMDFQKRLYKKHAHKMRYVDVCYGEDDINKEVASSKIVFGYSGNYYSAVRNIKPLAEAFGEFNEADLLVCGSGDVQIKESENIKVLCRVPQSEVSELEKGMDVLVCLLNHSCIQIPGKLFYNTNSNKIL